MLAIPYSVDRKLRTLPYVAYTLAGINVLIYLGCVFIGPEKYHELVRWGGVVASDLRPHTLLTLHFIHDAPLPLHLLGNLLFLLVFGRHIEDAVGRLWFAVIYFVGGLAATMIQTVMTLLFSPDIQDLPLIGASGAIASLMGVFAVRFYRTKVKVFWILGLGVFLNRAGIWRVSAVIVLALWGAWELVQQLLEIGVADVQEAGAVAHWAHLGGLGFGALVALAAGLHRQAQQIYTREDAYRFFRNGEMKKSADCFAEVIREYPEDADMRFKLAVALEYAHHRPRAMPHYTRAIELYARSGNIRDALRIYAKVSREPSVAQHLDPETFWQIGNYLAENCNYPAAVAAFASFANSQPGRSLAENARLRCADLLLRNLNQPAQAIPWYISVRDRGKNPDNVQRAIYGLAAAERALAAQGQERPPSKPQASPE